MDIFHDDIPIPFQSYLTHSPLLRHVFFVQPAPEELNKRLKEHMNKAGACLYAEVGRGQKGGAAFRTREEVPRADEDGDGTARCW